jgi:hypothetical protein
MFSLESMGDGWEGIWRGGIGNERGSRSGVEIILSMVYGIFLEYRNKTKYGIWDKKRRRLRDQAWTSVRETKYENISTRILDERNMKV